jgi:hypothetical protein
LVSSLLQDGGKEIMNYSRRFEFRGLPFIYEFSNDDSMDCAESAISGLSEQATKAIQDDEFETAVCEYAEEQAASGWINAKEGQR